VLPGAALPSVTVVTRLRLDAALYEPVAPRLPGRVGRPRKTGKRLPLDRAPGLKHVSESRDSHFFR
jgi:hypothetical protein